MTALSTTSSTIAISFCFPLISAVLIVLRFYIRHRSKTEKKLDDWLCIPAWLLMTGSCASLLVGVFENVFVNGPIDGPDSVSAQERLLAQITGAAIILWMSSNACIKLSVLFFYRRIFIGKIFDTCSHLLIGLTVVWYIYAVLSWLLFCGTDLKVNFEGGWLTCSQWGPLLSMAFYSLDSFLDFALLMLPIPFVWKLQLDLKRKVAVTISFLLGGFAFIAGLFNTVNQLLYITSFSSAESDGSGSFFSESTLLVFCNWPAIEIGVGLIAINLPSLSIALNKIPSTITRGIECSLARCYRVLSFSSYSAERRRGSSTREIMTQTDSDAERGQCEYFVDSLDESDSVRN